MNNNNMSMTIFSYCMNEDIRDKRKTVIKIFGLTDGKGNEKKTVCLNVVNFLPSIYMELPRNVEWTKPRIRLLLDRLKEISGRGGGLVKAVVIQGKKLYNSTKINDYPFVRLSFESIMYIKWFKKKIDEKAVNILSIGSVVLKIYEDDVQPLLQFYNRFDLPTVGWIQFTGKKVLEKETYCDFEYEIDCTLPGCLKRVNRNDIIKPVVISFDIEAYSSVKGSFPQAKRTGDIVFQISGVVLNKKGEIDKYLLTINEPDTRIVGEDVEVRVFENEIDLLQGFTDLIIEVNPQVIIGYNIFGFDIQYMVDRSQLWYIVDNFTKQSMMIGQQSKLIPIKWSSSAYGEQKLNFLDTFGRIYVDLLPIIRRNYNLDNYKLQTVSQKFLGQSKDPLDYKGIFRCYELSTPESLAVVGKYCVQDSMLVLNLFEHLQLWVELVELARICNVPIIYTYTRGQQVRVFSQVCKECIKQNIVVNKSEYTQHSSSEEFVGATVFEPVHGIHENVVSFDFCLTGDTLVSLSNGTSKRLDQIVAGDKVISYIDGKYDEYNIIGDLQIKGKKQTVKVYTEDGTIVICTPNHKFLLENGIWCEAQNLKNKLVISYSCKKVDECTIFKQRVVDVRKFKVLPVYDIEVESSHNFIANGIVAHNCSLYPSTIIAYNISYDTIITDNSIPDNECNIVSWQEKISDESDEYRSKKYRFRKEQIGVLPIICKDLLEARASVRKEMKGVTDKAILSIMDKRQLALKVSANSVYGSLGTNEGYLPFMPGAECTTAMGRKNILKASEFMKNEYGAKILYGDTDSNYISFPKIPIAELNSFCYRVQDEVSAIFPRPMKMAYEEKIMRYFLIFTKKRYIALEYPKPGQSEGEIIKKGVILVRRDTCKIAREIFTDIINTIFKGGKRAEVEMLLLDKLNDMFCMKYDYMYYKVTKSVKDISEYKIRELPDDSIKKFKRLKELGCESEDDYKALALPPHVQLSEKLKLRGEPSGAGSRIEYVIIEIAKTQKSDEKLFRKIEELKYFGDHRHILRLDYQHYLEHMILNPISELLTVIGFNPKFLDEQIKLRKSKKNICNQIQQLNSPEIIFD